MKSIFITGDCHGELSHFSDVNYYNYKKELRESDKKENFVIICGDFGFIWKQNEDKEEERNLKIINDKPFTTLFIDGNHENFERLCNEYPKIDFMGGKAHKIRDNIYHLMRGEIYSILGNTFFTFGGARSHDISDGILDGSDPNWKKKSKALDKQYKFCHRVKGISWWEEEMPTKEEMQNGLDNLKKYNNKVDYIITHQPPENIVLKTFVSEICVDDFTKYLEDLDYKVDYQKWFSGHIHIDHHFDTKHISMYHKWIKIV